MLRIVRRDGQDDNGRPTHDVVAGCLNENEDAWLCRLSNPAACRFDIWTVEVCDVHRHLGTGFRKTPPVRPAQVTVVTVVHSVTSMLGEELSS
jgi:hypothetical protein